MLYRRTTKELLNKNAGVRTMLDLLLCSVWFIFGAYSFWFCTQTKTFQPLTLDDLALTWKLHKQQTRCKASHIRSILTKNDEVVGFKCDCGHEFLQRRLITQKAHKHVHTDMHTLQKTSGFLKNLGFHYSYIKEI